MFIISLLANADISEFHQIHNELANYFVTSSGSDLISNLIDALEDAKSSNKSAAIVQC